MTNYISLLRGINVGGQKRMKMDALKLLYERLNFQNVQTYLQSGNVIFGSEESNPQDIAKIIELEIEKEFGFQVPVMVMNAESLLQIVTENPLYHNSIDISFLHVTFLAAPPTEFNTQSIEDKKQANEEIAFTTHAVYLYCPNGYGKTKLNNTLIENKLKVQATTRNWKTVTELLKLATK